MARKQRIGRFSWIGQNIAQPINNQDLSCRDCKFRINDNVSQCEQYKVEKPAKVLLGDLCDVHEEGRINEN